MEKSHVIFEPLNAKLTESLSSLAIEVIFFIGTPPLANVSNCCVRSFALNEASSSSVSLL